MRNRGIRAAGREPLGPCRQHTGDVQACVVTARSGEFDHHQHDPRARDLVVIWACVSSPEAFCSPTIVASANGSPLASRRDTA